MAAKSYKLTRIACYGASFSQATVVMFLPLLYVMFHTTFGISLSMIALFGTVNFAVQLLTDLLAAKLTVKAGYRASALLAHVCIITGFILLAVLPFVMPPFAGIMIAVVVYAVGGGLVEVIASPIIESCPTPDKKRQMAILHAMYPIGSACMIGFSALFFWLFGIDNWRIAALILTAMPITTLILFAVCPMEKPNAYSEEATSEECAAQNAPSQKPKLFSSLSFYLFVLLILCAGASEQAIAQWISAYAELSLGISKTMSDIFGPLSFMLVFTAMRLLYAAVAEKISTHLFLLCSGALAVSGFLLASVVPNHIVNLIGCLLAGAGIAAMWPAVLSLAAGAKGNNTTLFSFLAFGGDVGCGLGTYCIGAIGERTSLQKSVLCASVFPLLFTLTIIVHALLKNKQSPQSPSGDSSPC